MLAIDGHNPPSVSDLSHNRPHKRLCHDVATSKTADSTRSEDPMAAPTSFASVTNLQHLEDMYAKWQADPASVDRDWQTFFAGFDLGVARPSEKQKIAGGAHH